MATLNEHASYEAVPVRVLEHELNRQIEAAIRNGQHFYIGVASAHGTPIESMCHREGTSCEPYAERCSQKSRHHADAKAKAKGLTLEKVFYADDLFVKNEVCELEMELIAQYRGPLCLNERSGHDNCIKGDKGIVYLRIYSGLREPDNNSNHMEARGGSFLRLLLYVAELLLTNDPNDQDCASGL